MPVLYMFKQVLFLAGNHGNNKPLSLIYDTPLIDFWIEQRKLVNGKLFFFIKISGPLDNVVDWCKVHIDLTFMITVVSSQKIYLHKDMQYSVSILHFN